MRKTVLTTGVFDILHPGHIKAMEEAKKLGGANARLVVLVARDSTARKLKARQPVFKEKARLFMVSSLKPVDYALLGYKPFSFEKVVNRVRPDVVAFGHDQTRMMRSFAKLRRERRWDIEIRRLNKFRVGEVNSTTSAIEKILAGSRRP